MNLRPLIRILDSQSQFQVVILAVTLAILVTGFNLHVGSALQAGFFYVVPVALVAWYVGRRASVSLAILCAALWLTVEELAAGTTSDPALLGWRFLARATLLVMEGVVLAQLRSQFDEIVGLASKDPLTGLPNRRAFDDLVAREMKDHHGDEPLTLVYLDCDGIDWINNRFGYVAGDHLLCVIAELLGSHLPRPDLIGRVGGTTFAALLPSIDTTAAGVLLKQLQERLQDERKKYAQPIVTSINAMTCARAPHARLETGFSRDVSGGRNCAAAVV
ncbi:MAG: GGDEF domain-containing protein, partial [Deltaproteobacteria bacterium]|nr:GGDEF domain-containing protein [Deltaproteobacteria bacterium]